MLVELRQLRLDAAHGGDDLRGESVVHSNASVGCLDSTMVGAADANCDASAAIPAAIGAPCAIRSAPAASVPLQGAAGVNTSLIEKKSGANNRNCQRREQSFQSGHHATNSGGSACREIEPGQPRLAA